MLVKFYENIAVTNEVYNIIEKTREACLIKEDVENELKRMENRIINTDELAIHDSIIHYLILAIGPEHQNIIIKLFLEMEKYDFKNCKSVVEEFNGAGQTESQYEKLAKINLYDHTVNCAIQTVEQLTASDTPIHAIGISLIISILHDFGKAPLLKNKYGRANFRHQNISAEYAKEILSEMQEKELYEVNKELIDIVYKTLNQHHSSKQEQNIFLDILNAADFAAREKEEKYLKIQKGNKQ
jgi:hypothetical protein